jgi:hypothetical protein
MFYSFIAIKPEDKYRFCAAAILFFHILKKVTLIRVAYFSEIFYCTSFQGPVLNGISPASTSQVCAYIHIVFINCRKLKNIKLEWPRMSC